MPRYEPNSSPRRAMAIGGTLVATALASLIALGVRRRPDTRSAPRLTDTGHTHRNLYDRGSDSETRAGKWRLIKTGHDLVAVEIVEVDGASRFRVWPEQGEPWPASDVRVVTERWNGDGETFTFAERDGFLESTSEVPRPHSFFARVTLAHGQRAHDYELAFLEDEDSPETRPNGADRQVTMGGRCQIVRMPGRRP